MFGHRRGHNHLQERAMKYLTVTATLLACTLATGCAVTQNTNDVAQAITAGNDHSKFEGTVHLPAHIATMPGSRVVCRREVRTGTHMKTKSCRTAAQIEAGRAAALLMQKNRRNQRTQTRVTKAIY